MKSRTSLIRLKRFQADEKRRQVLQIETMVAEFSRMAQDLSDQIVAEQNRVGIHDITHFAYPTFAKAAMTRRDNLLASIEELKVKLERARDELALAAEDLKKVELMEERDQQRERAERDAEAQAALDEIGLRRAMMAR